MKGFLVFIMLALLVPVHFASATDGICACYYGDEGFCGTVSVDEAGTPIETSYGCTDYCGDMFGIESTNSVWADDNSSEEGITVQEDCTLSDEDAQSLATMNNASPSSSTASATQSRLSLIKPRLNIDIPTVTFSDGVMKDGVLNVNYLGEYIAGIYTYLLGIATTIAIVMLMIGGLQWAIGGVSAESIGKAKTRIKNAATGLVLLMSTYLILYTVNPELIKLQFPELSVAQFIPISTEDTGSDVSTLQLSGCAGSGTNNVPYFCQRNYGSVVYGKDCQDSPTIKSSGCGPTSLAMVLNFYGANEDPKSVASSFEAGGYRVCGSGSSYSGFTNSTAVTSNNMQGEIIPIADHTSITSHLQADQPIIISVGKSRFTNGGHFIVLTGINQDGTFSINDPNSGIQSAEPSEIWGIMKFAVYVHKKN